MDKKIKTLWIASAVTAAALALTVAVGANNGTFEKFFPAVDAEGNVQEIIENPVFSTNENGQSYGVNANMAPSDYPDLVAVVATNGENGYCYASDLEDPFQPKNPEEAAAHQKLIDEQGYSERIIPVYESDGKTVIGEFRIGNGYAF